MKIEELYLSSYWSADSRTEALTNFERVVDGFESEAMSRGIVLDWSTLELTVERVEQYHESDDDDEADQLYYSKVATAGIKGVKVADGLDNDEGGA